ncbi:MAG: VWA domain-containing protein [Candidatus Acidiferrum sp.]
MRWLALLAFALMGMVIARAQETSGTPASGQPSGTAPTSQNPASTQAAQPAALSTASLDTQQPKTAEPKAELSSKDTSTTFKLRVNLVQVKVIVRDSKGELVRDLKREDFQVYDQGKLQAISTFDVETVETRRKRMEEAAKTQQGAEEQTEGEVALPERFVALVFDDIHLQMQDAMFARNSAKKLIENMTPSDRIGIFGTSEQLKLEYTSDKAALIKTLDQVLPRPKMGKINSVTNCPDVTHYMADQAINKSDPTVLPVVASETLQCMFQGNPQMMQQAQTIAQSALQEALVAGDEDNEYTYRALEDVIRRLGGMPGERVMVLASPGFLLSMQFLDEMGIIDRANHASIVINTVDARGLYTPDILDDISQINTDTPQTASMKTQFRTQEQFDDAFVLGDFANGTGGTFFQNSNDLATGLSRAGAAPEVSYVLGFSPQNQKMDGKYHTIKVTLTDKRKYNIQARRGYYAPRKVNDPNEQAKAEIQEAVFSQDEIQELPLDFQTQYFKTGDAGAHLSVVSRIDVKGIHFRKADGRNFDDLTVATVIFDENGNFVTGGEKILEMRLLDKTFDRLAHTGLVMKSSFELKPGKYMVRQVVRDSEGAQMAAKNGAVVIPY